MTSLYSYRFVANITNITMFEYSVFTLYLNQFNKAYLVCIVKYALLFCSEYTVIIINYDNYYFV